MDEDDGRSGALAAQTGHADAPRDVPTLSLRPHITHTSAVILGHPDPEYAEWEGESKNCVSVRLIHLPSVLIVFRAKGSPSSVTRKPVQDKEKRENLPGK